MITFLSYFFSNGHRILLSSNSNQSEISSNPTNNGRHNDLPSIRNNEVSELENPPSYNEIEMQDILPTYEEANFNELCGIKRIGQINLI